MKGRKNDNSSKRLVSTFTLMVTILTITLCLLGAIAALQPAPVTTSTYSFYSSPSEHIFPLGGITWDVRVNFSETGGKADFVYIGEATDARDGPPADSYDTTKPPAPPTPYIYTSLSDNLPAPYDILSKDYRYYPGIHKIWNLTVQWMPKSPYPSTTVTIFWSRAKINTSEYDTVILLNGAGVQVANMRTTGSYSFTCPPFAPQAFQINCTVDTKPPQIINRFLELVKLGIHLPLMQVCSMI